jgi:hypothetical protein
MDSYSAATPRAETACREAAVMAASTKAARRLGRNEMATWSFCIPTVTAHCTPAIQPDDLRQERVLRELEPCEVKVSCTVLRGLGAR